MKERRRLVGAASFVAFAVAAIVAATAGGGSGDRDPRPAAAPARIQGFVAELLDRRREIEPGQVAWQTRWRLCWEPQRGARDYLVTIVTFEGVQPDAQRTRDPCYSLTIASGSGPVGEVRQQPSAQLDLVESTLSVSVAARMRDGRVGPASPDFPVGRPYRAGRKSAPGR